MTYRQLNERNLLEYIESMPVLASRFDEQHLHDLQITEIGDGNLNYVFLITDRIDSSNQLIIKQAVPFCRCLGESYPLGIERMHYEIRSLNYFAALCPQHVPEIVLTDETMALVAMQYLGAHVTARNALMNGEHVPLFIDHVTSFMARVLFHTSSFNLSGHEKRQLMQQFNLNSDLCKITEDYVFTLPFIESHEEISEDVRERILALKYHFMNSNQALLHGDMHTGSMMINDDETYIIDSEFAVFGPIGFDVGMFIANMIFAWMRHEVIGNQQSAHLYKRFVIQTWQLFADKFKHAWMHAKLDNALGLESMSLHNRDAFQQSFLHSVLQDTVGFAACELLRRILGVAKVADIESIIDSRQKQQAKTSLIHIACQLLRLHQEIRSIEEIECLLTPDCIRKDLAEKYVSTHNSPQFI